MKSSFCFCVALLTLTACGGGGGGGEVTANPQSLCAALNGRSFVTADGVATITAVTLVPPANGHPENCYVSGVMPTALQFEMRMPTNWNQRVLYLGGGGFDGVVPELLPPALAQGYAIVGSNGGHPLAANENWALDPLQLNDFAYLSVHKTLTAAREIIAQRYRQLPLRTYFEGCSNGGREALIQAQRYPNDFDGIIARAPAWNFVELMLAGNKSAQQFFGSTASQLSAAKINTLSAAVLTACDALDNIQDGIVSNVAACRTAFNPTNLRCPTGTDTNSCLTDAQLATVNTVYSVFNLNTTPPVPYYIGWPAGGESDAGGWPFWVASQASGLPSFSSRFIQYFLQQGPTYNALNFVPENNLPIIANRIQLIDAAATDYSAFRARGGKLILWHGTNDWAISFNSTALYYNNVVAAAG
ncbi:MAG: tannase/feruloyl esterase family alpha/beta hydrolase, partial [Candidatus Obscuribacterales bacterium]|nr:tannase/feruloyl esterase family alpha/beta hydrolase [Steroidobacteraceae bacterium]